MYVLCIINGVEDGREVDKKKGEKVASLCDVQENSNAAKPVEEKRKQKKKVADTPKTSSPRKKDGRLTCK